MLEQECFEMSTKVYVFDFFVIIVNHTKFKPKEQYRRIQSSKEIEDKFLLQSQGHISN